MTAIHQFVPMLHLGDAVGRHTLGLRDVMVARGIRSRIYVERSDPDTMPETRPFAAYAEESDPHDVLLYQFATASDMAPWLAQRSETLVVNYHNVTPPEYYAPWDNGMARHQLRAQSQLRLLAPRAALGLAVSAFNEAELRRSGFVRTVVVPPAAMLPVQPPLRAPDRPRRGARWVSIGRLAPNKGIEDALFALLVTREHLDSAATLTVVGRPVVSAYTAALARSTDELGLRQAVTFSGALSDADLSRALAGSDVLVVTSRHEGFGVPVLEALAAQVPVVANASGALPEVLGDAGLLVPAGDPYAVAGAVARVLGDADLREELAVAARRRLVHLDLASAGARAVDAIAALAG